MVKKEIDKKCWVCGRTAEELRKIGTFDEDGYEDGEEFLVFKPKKTKLKLDDVEIYEYFISTAKIRLYLCRICNELFHNLFEEKLECLTIEGSTTIDCGSINFSWNEKRKKIE